MLGLIGIGLMGEAMAQKIVANGKELNVYNRTQSKADKLSSKGAKVFKNITGFFRNTDVVILMLSDYNAIFDLLFEKNTESFSGKTIIQMGTIAPEESREIYRRVEKLRGEYFEAPVLGSIPQIQNKELIILVGSKESQYLKWLPLFKLFGSKIIRIGDFGTAAAMKLALNQLIISETAAFSMSLGYLRRKGLDIDVFMDILRGSALFAPTFDKKLKNMLERDFDNANFPLKHLLKDLDLILGEFGDNNINTNALKGIRKVLIDSIQKGLSDKDYSALYNSIDPIDAES